jgi:hypothetical protein
MEPLLGIFVLVIGGRIYTADVHPISARNFMIPGIRREIG